MEGRKTRARGASMPRAVGSKDIQTVSFTFPPQRTATTTNSKRTKPQVREMQQQPVKKLMRSNEGVRKLPLTAATQQRASGNIPKSPVEDCLDFDCLMAEALKDYDDSEVEINEPPAAEVIDADKYCDHEEGALNENVIVQKRPHVEPPLVTEELENIGVQDQMLQNQHDILMNLQTIMLRLSTLEERQTRILKVLAVLSEENAKTQQGVKTLSLARGMLVNDDVFSTMLPEEPYEDHAQLLEFEETLKDNETFHRLVRDLYNVAARDGKSYTAKCWRALLKDTAANKFSWHGTESKFAIKSLLVTAAIKCAFQNKFPQAELIEFEDRSKKFFNYANDRLSKIVKRTK